MKRELIVDEFKVSVPEEVLTDLRDRLARTRYPNQLEAVGWSQGVSLDYLQAIVRYWRESYDWRRYEDELNSFDQYRTEVDDQPIHFFHVRSPHPEATPLLLLHGWNATAAEFIKVLGPLSDPVAHGYPDAVPFHVVAPNLPGFAFSGPTLRTGWGPRKMGEAFVRLMDHLGYPRFIVQGGDMGSAVAMNLADAAPDHVLGLHMNYAPDMRSRADFEAMRLPEWLPWESLTRSEREGMVAGALSRRTILGWHEVKAKEPQSFGYLLEDSPAALAAAMLWSQDETRALTREIHFSRDGLLDFITSLWVTGTAASSCRVYYELNQRIRENVPRRFVGVPTGIAIYPGEPETPRRWVERGYNVVHWAQLPRGGHFAAYEAPDLFVSDISAFERTIRPTAVRAPTKP